MYDTNDMRNPIKIMHRDLPPPLTFKFIFRHTHGTFEESGYVFRKINQKAIN